MQKINIRKSMSKLVAVAITCALAGGMTSMNTVAAHAEEAGDNISIASLYIPGTPAEGAVALDDATDISKVKTTIYLTAVDTKTKMHVGNCTGTGKVDIDAHYENMFIGGTYTLAIKVYDKDSGEFLFEVEDEKKKLEFTVPPSENPEDNASGVANGKGTYGFDAFQTLVEGHRCAVVVEMTGPLAEDVAKEAAANGGDISKVDFSKVKRGVVATSNNDGDENVVCFPEIDPKATATPREDGLTTVTDAITMKGLPIGMECVIESLVKDVGSGVRPYQDENGNDMKLSKEFKPEAATVTESMDFIIDKNKLTYASAVATKGVALEEALYVKNPENGELVLVAEQKTRSHATVDDQINPEAANQNNNANNAGQNGAVNSEPYGNGGTTSPSGEILQTGDTALPVIIGTAVAAIAVGGAYKIRRKKRM